LLNLEKLRNLLLFGNKIVDLSLLIELISSLSRLETLDLRYNPCTARFYAELDPSDELAYCTSSSTYQIDINWIQADEMYQGYLDNVAALERDTYRDSIIFVARRLVELDGIPITQQQRRQAGSVLLNGSSTRGINSSSIRLRAVNSKLSKRSEEGQRQRGVNFGVDELIRPNTSTGVVCTGIRPVTSDGKPNDGPSLRKLTKFSLFRKR